MPAPSVAVVVMISILMGIDIHSVVSIRPLQGRWHERFAEGMIMNHAAGEWEVDFAHRSLIGQRNFSILDGLTD